MDMLITLRYRAVSDCGGALASQNYAAAMNIDSTATSWQWNQTMLFRGQGCTLRILSEVDFNCELKLSLYLMRVR